MLKPQFKMTDINSRIAEAKKNIRLALLQSLRYVGEEFITNARQVDSYKDQTGNLRNSIGYLILVDGAEVESHFEGTGEGREKGQEFAKETAAQYPSGFVLIVVAGMSYARHVENMGYDVLTGSSFRAEATLKKLLNQIKLSSNNTTF